MCLVHSCGAQGQTVALAWAFGEVAYNEQQACQSEQSHAQPRIGQGIRQGPTIPFGTHCR